MEQRQFILELIDVYRTLPALWDTKCKEYSDKHTRDMQYDILLQKFKEKNPEAGRRKLAKKINTLRTNYRKELKKIASLEKSGTSAGEFKSALFYFDAISFLRQNETEECEYQQSKSTKQTANDKLLELATKQLLQGQNRFEKITEIWASQLVEMDQQQRIFAEKFISDILFEGKLGTLHRNAITFNTCDRNSISDTAVFAGQKINCPKNKTLDHDHNCYDVNMQTLESSDSFSGDFVPQNSSVIDIKKENIEEDCTEPKEYDTPPFVISNYENENDHDDKNEAFARHSSLRGCFFENTANSSNAVHFPDVSPIRKRCRQCHRNKKRTATKYICGICRTKDGEVIGLCPHPCFKLWHHNQQNL